MNRKIRACFAAALITVLLSTCSSHPARRERSADRDRRFQEVDALLSKQREELNIPGISFAIVENGRVVYLKAFGVRNVESKLPMTVDTVTPIGSCTKAFTSMALGIAQDEGRASLDDSPKRFLPWFQLADPDADRKVTIRDLLTHRTGLKTYADLAAEPGILTREEYVRATMLAKPAVKFGSGFQYSNAMYTAAGLILGRIYGSTWEEAIEHKIFQTLSMTSSFASATDGLKAANHATGYLFDATSKSWKAIPPPLTLQTMAPAGNISSTARDMTHWLLMLTDGGQMEGRTFVSKKTLDELTTPINPINKTLSYACGWTGYQWKGHRVVEHNGGSTGISALMSFMPDRRLGFVFLANTSPNAMTKIGNAGRMLWPILTGQSDPDFSVSSKPDETAASPAPEETAKDNLPSVDSLLERMIRAAGGDENLRRHKSLEIHARKQYENQGVSAELRIVAKEPAMREEDEGWSAAGREIGRVRVFFDGRTGGQETTFGQDQMNDEAANESARTDYAFEPLLKWKSLYKETVVEGHATLDGSDAYVLRITPVHGDPVRLFVDADSFFIVRREANGQTSQFRDYREVDGEWIPFETVIEDPLGEATIRVTQAAFNVDVDDKTTFGPAKH